MGFWPPGHSFAVFRDRLWQDRREEPLGIFREDIELEVDGIVLRQCAEIGFFQGVRNDPNREGIFTEFADSEAHPIDGDGAFPGHITHEFLRDSNYDLAIFSLVLRLEDRSHRIDVALDKVSSEAGVRAESAFEIHGCALPEVAEVCALQGFLQEVKNQLLSSMSRECQATAIDGDAVPSVNRTVDRPGRESELGARGRTPEPEAFADLFNESCKHEEELRTEQNGMDLLT